MVHGYVLITASLGKALEVAEKVSKVKGVKKACAVTGKFDVVASFEVENISEVAEVVVKGIHGIEGVCGTQTLICVHCEKC